MVCEVEDVSGLCGFKDVQKCERLIMAWCVWLKGNRYEAESDMTAETVLFNFGSSRAVHFSVKKNVLIM